MSNTLRHVGSGRGVEGTTRAPPGAATPSPAGDGDFALAMTRAIGAAPGQHGDGGDADGAATAQSGHGDGKDAATAAAIAPNALPDLTPSTDTGTTGTTRTDTAAPAQPDTNTPATGAAAMPSEITPSDAGTIPDGRGPAMALASAPALSIPTPHREERRPRAATALAGAAMAPANPIVTVAVNAAGASIGVGVNPPALPALSTLPASPRNDSRANDRVSSAPPSVAVIAAAPQSIAPRSAPLQSIMQPGSAPAAVAGAAPAPLAGDPPSLPAGAATITAAPPPTKIAPAAANQLAGQESGEAIGNDVSDGIGAPAPANNAARRGDSDSTAPGPNPSPATLQPAIIGLAAPGVGAPAFDPRTRQAAASDPAQIGASSALAGAAPSNPTAATATAAPAATVSGDSGTPGASPLPFGDTLANHVVTMAATGHQETILQIQPPQLGDLTVRIMVQGRDVSAWFGAAQPQVQQAVSQALGQLRLDLAGAGFTLTGAGVGADMSGAQRQFAGTAAPARRSGFAPTAIERTTGDGAEPPSRSSGLSVYV